MTRTSGMRAVHAAGAIVLALAALAACNAQAVPGAPAEPGNRAAAAAAPPERAVLAAGEVRIVGTDFGFSPRRIQVPAGRPVRFVFENRGAIAHDWVLKDRGFHLNAKAGGEASGEYTFEQPGQVDVVCTFPSHQLYGMAGEVVVVADAAAAPRGLDEAVAAAKPIPPGTMRLPLPAVAPPVTRTGPASVDVEMETREVLALVDDQVATTFWTFGGTVPGPMVRVRAGDTVNMRLKNAIASKESHSIDFHAATGPGGGGKVTQIGPGGQAEFKFKALNPGVYVYHCATPKVAHHIANGMYGLIVVEPQGGWPKVDREFYVMQGDLYLDGGRGVPGVQGTSFAKNLDERPDYVLMNGSVGALTGERALKAKAGETVRIFFGVGGPNLTSSFHVIGEIFDRVYAEGATESVTNVQTTLVPAGGSAIVDFKVDVPGNFALVDHSLGRLEKGNAGILTVEGAERPEVFQAGAKADGGHADAPGQGAAGHGEMPGGGHGD